MGLIQCKMASKNVGKTHACFSSFQMSRECVWGLFALRIYVGAGEVAQWLRALVALASQPEFGSLHLSQVAYKHKHF